MSNDYFKAQGWFKNYALTSQDSRGLFQQLVKEDEEDFKMASAKVQEPRNMYADGQLVKNTDNGSRPGYSGETLSEIMAKDKSLVAELKGFYEDGLGAETIIKNKNPTNPENKKYFTKDRLNRFFKYAKKNLGFSQRESGKLNSKIYLDKIQKIADKPEYKLFNKRDLWTKNGPDGKPPLKKKEAEKVNAQRDYRFNNQEENIIKRNDKRKKITEENSSNYLEGKAKGDKKLNLSHSSFFDKTSLNNLIYADASANRKMYGKFEEPLQKKMKEFMDIYNSDASPEIKNKAKIDLQKFDTDLRSKFPEYAKLKSYFNFKDTAFEPGFMYNEKLIDPSMAISEEVGTEFKGTEPKSLKSNVIIEKAKSNFDKAMEKIKNTDPKLAKKVSIQLNSGLDPLEILKEIRKIPGIDKLGRGFMKVGGPFELAFIGLDAVNELSKGKTGEQSLKTALSNFTFGAYKGNKIEDINVLLDTAKNLNIDSTGFNELLELQYLQKKLLTEKGNLQKTFQYGMDERSSKKYQDIVDKLQNEFDTKSVALQEKVDVNSLVKNYTNTTKSLAEQQFDKSKKRLLDSPDPTSGVVGNTIYDIANYKTYLPQNFLQNSITKVIPNTLRKLPFGVGSIFEPTSPRAKLFDSSKEDKEIRLGEKKNSVLEELQTPYFPKAEGGIIGLRSKYEYKK